MYKLSPAIKIPAPAANGNLVDIAESLGLTTLVALAKEADIAGVLAKGQDLTLFGPTDEGLAKIPYPFKPWLSNTTLLRILLLDHVVKGRVYANQIENELLVPSMEANPKFYIRFNIYKNKVVTAQCAKIIKVNQNASNGVLHVLDGVIVPAAYTITKALQVYKQYYSTLLTAVTIAKLDGVLAGEGPFTIFAPTNEAFFRIPADKLKKILANIPLLTKILKYHVVSGTFCSAGLEDGKNVPTLEGSNVKVGISGNGVFVNNARVEYPDAMMTNGVFHSIDTVLIPDDVEL